MEVSLQDSVLLEQVVDPNSQQYKELLSKLIRRVDDGRTRFERLNNVGVDAKFVLSYRGDADAEHDVESRLPVRFSERAVFRNGAASLALAAADLMDLVVQASGRRRMTATLVVSEESPYIYDSMVRAGSNSPIVYYCKRKNLYSECASLADKLEAMVFDHTTINLPVDQLLNFAYDAGVRVVDGVFPYHVAARHGWDVVAGFAHWSYTHSGSHLSVGPDDDPSRLLRYKKSDYMKFVEPSGWEGNSRKYFYEVRKCENGLATYRAVYVGDELPESDRTVSFKFPMCTSEDMILISLNRELAAGVFVSRSNNARELAELEKNYALEVRRDLFNSAVTYLISMQKDQDIVGNAIRYIQQHNYVDLVEGVRVIRCPSLSYADALCVALVAALVAFEFRWKLTGQSIAVLKRSTTVARLVEAAPFGALGRLAWLFYTYLSDTLEGLKERVVSSAVELFRGSEYIPGVCYDVYLDSSYQMEGDWFEPHLLQLKPADLEAQTLLGENDPFLGFFGDNVDTSAPSAVAEKTTAVSEEVYRAPPYVPNIVPDPVAAMQEAYDVAFPGNSTAQLQNVAELRRVRDVNINTEFFGKVEINKDISAPEQLHVDMPVRTSALPTSRTPLLDAMLASAKRNFNPPDLQLQTAVFSFARELAEEFISHCFVLGYNSTLRVAYEKDPVTLNMTDYMAWLANKDGRYRSALEAECPTELVELELDRFDTIIKKRVKPKLSVMAQHELSQPQVIVSLSKKDTAPFTSVHRRIFERLDSALRPEFKSAGRSSDDEISQWMTEFFPQLVALEALELDSGKYDKSQNLLARLIESFVLEALGLDPGVNEVYKDSYVGKVSSRALGIAFMSVYQMKSGAPDTMLGNLLYNMVSACRCVGYENIRFMIAKGDDNVIWLKSAVRGSVVVSKMSHLFNLEAKLVAGSVIYFSSGYLLFFDNRGYFAPDPLKLLEIQGEGGVSVDTLSSQFQSFKDRSRSYIKHHHLPRVLELAVRARHSSPDIPVVSLVDAFLAMAEDESLYRFVKTGVRSS